MKALLYLLLLACSTAFAQTPGFNYYVPASGVQFNTGATAINSAATSAQIAATFNGQAGCTGAAALLYSGACGVSGTVTSVSIAVPAPLTGTACSGSSIIACAITWTASQPANQFLATPDGVSGPVGLRAIDVADIPTLNQSTTGNAATSTAFASIPAQCSGSTFATGITANGTANCATPAGGGNVSNVGAPTNGQIAQWTGATTIQGVTLVPISAGGTGTASPAIVAGTNVTVSGSWPNQTINSTGGSGSGANPTASVGLTAVNGTATTFLRSDGAPALSQSISPTMTGTWTWSSTTSGGITPATAVFAEDFHLNDQQVGGHSYGQISGYCGGASPGTWTLYDYTAALSRLCVTSAGTLTMSNGFQASAASSIQVANGADTYLDVTTASTRNVFLEENDTGSTSGNGMPAHSQGLATATGNLFFHASGGSVVTDGAFVASGNIIANQSGNLSIVQAFDAGTDGICIVVNYSGSPACNGFPTGAQGIGTYNGTLFLHAGNGAIATDATSVPWPAYSTGSTTLTYSSGCGSGSFAPTVLWTKIGNAVTFKLTPSSCTSAGGTVIASGWPTAIAPASNTGIAAVIESNSSQAVGLLYIAASPTNTLTISTILSGATGTASSDETSGSYNLN